MVQQIPETQTNIIYPESDGQPMADNTLQFRWIVTIKENLEILFSEDENVFVAGDLLWYPVEGKPKIRQAPDVLVVFGRTKGERGSYRQWEENNIAPQVVFEILSPGNRPQEMMRKLLFYQQYGVEEYYTFDPQNVEFMGSLRVDEHLEEIETPNGWVSPRLQIRFELTENTLEIYRPDGRKFLTSVELNQRAEEALAQLEEERTLRQQEQQRYQALIERLREQGLDPEQFLNG
ncbi:MAG: Uma2 family endonuclease [Lyngbya sp.]|nr:Uma2 family endonuclease [Lyngbya sp.]